MKYAVVGSRTFTDRALLEQVLSERIGPYDQVISGACKGPDTWAVEWAKAHDILYEEFTADWNTYGKRAGFLRNETVVAQCDAVIAFWANKSKGTKHTIMLAYNANKDILVVFPSGRIKERKRIG